MYFTDPDVDAEQAGKYIEAQAAVVFNEIGGYMSEKVLQESFALHLRALGHTVSTGRIVPILFRGENVGFMAMDIMVENVILELKAVDKISETHKGQLAAYLRYSGLKLGFVVNFNSKTNRIDVAQIKIA